jgi:hypothetical protein
MVRPIEQLHWHVCTILSQVCRERRVSLRDIGYSSIGLSMYCRSVALISGRCNSPLSFCLNGRWQDHDTLVDSNSFSAHSAVLTVFLLPPSFFPPLRVLWWGGAMYSVVVWWWYHTILLLCTHTLISQSSQRTKVCSSRQATIIHNKK